MANLCRLHVKRAALTVTPVQRHHGAGLGQLVRRPTPVIRYLVDGLLPGRLERATGTRSRRWSAPPTAGGGLLLGLALYCSYGIAPLGLLVVAVVVSARRLRPLLVGALGFWWWTGLAATRVRYAEGIATIRPYDYFVLANLAAFAVALGPATVAGLASLHRRSRLRWPVGAALLAVAGADLSGLSKGEVERIWLPIGAACAYGDLEGHVWFELKFVRVDQSRPAAQVCATNPGQ